MTQTELKYWGAPSYPVTVTPDDSDWPLGWMENGTFHPITPSNLGKTVVVDGVEMEVVWHGGSLLPLDTTDQGYYGNSPLSSKHEVSCLTIVDASPNPSEQLPTDGA